MLNSLDHLKDLVVNDIESGLQIALICDRDETLGPTPVRMDDQVSVIGKPTVDALQQIHSHPLGFVALVSGRRVSELVDEKGVDELPLFGCTGDWAVWPRQGGISLSGIRPASWETARTAMEGFSHGSTLFTESKLSLSSEERYENALSLVEELGALHPGQWVVKKYPQYNLVELLPASASKSNAVQHIAAQMDSDVEVRFVYVGNGRNDIPAMAYVVKETGGYGVFVGNAETEKDIAECCTHKVRNFQEVRLFVDWLRHQLESLAKLLAKQEQLVG